MQVYVASSWRNPYQADVVAALRAAGHGVYDFKEPTPGGAGFSWSAIDPNWKQWTPQEYVQALHHPIAQAGYENDMTGLDNAQLCLFLGPAGPSAMWELGYAKGKGILTAALLLGIREPDLMIAGCGPFFFDVSDLLAWLEEKDRRIASYLR